MGTGEQQVLKSIVCLANSRKDAGRCIAGIELQDSETETETERVWIRPVSDSANGEVLAPQRQLLDGSEPEILDVLEIGLADYCPQTYQSENWLIAPRKWVRTGRANWATLASMHDRRPLWIEEGLKTDRLSLDFAASLDDSIRLIRVDTLTTYVTRNFDGSRLQHRAKFTQEGVDFDLVITDPWYESLRREHGPGDGAVELLNCYLTISLSHPYPGGYCYKLVAAIITRDRVDEGGG